PGIVSMIENKLIRHVSIEAMFSEVDRSDGRFIARGIEFLGFDLVKTPGHPNTSLSLEESLNSLFFNPFSNMEAFKKAMEQISKKASILKEDVSLLEALLECVEEDQKEACKTEISKLSERLSTQTTTKADKTYSQEDVE